MLPLAHCASQIIIRTDIKEQSSLIKRRKSRDREFLLKNVYTLYSKGTKSSAEFFDHTGDLEHLSTNDAAAVETNARDYRQAESGIKDFENIAREIVNYGKP